jgi:eukaryotic-like serine/threonine-protein kinase
MCPDCLLKVGLGSVPEPSGTIRVAHELLRPRELPNPGTQFGGYRIMRELGRGGMGAVYEAEHLESGRFVALKVLGHQLDSMADRARFLREGRMAASINHPNSVYVFGTEEIDDTPVIAMELIAGGTLQERVQRSGPFAVPEAVDAILQLIAGLEAAQAIGILHRDIKPANCFQDIDGTVKIGDFGLSISTAARGDTSITMQGQFLGTPAFCSPEQLRGEELNVRSDIYSVGVTLFYLLTGRTPFEGRNMVQLLANALEQPAPSPKKLRAEIPQGLANVVLRCLQKQPGERFKTYDELRQALAPFSSEAPVPAPLAIRFVAHTVDGILLAGTIMLVSMLGFKDLAIYTNPSSYRSVTMFAVMSGGIAVSILYYALLEGIRGASLGKMLFRLRVARPDRNPPGFWKALARACIFLLAPILPFWVGMLIDSEGFSTLGTSWTRYGNIGYYVFIAILFSTARTRNGFAAIHDLITRTRVIRKPAHQARPVLAADTEPTHGTESQVKVGPFHVIESLEKNAEGEWLLGYDTRLLRRVWIHVLPPGMPPMAPSLRNLGRVGRLRWISGRRSPEENWDVFEGMTGTSLLQLIPQKPSWTQVRFWLMDLATEISAAEKDGTLPGVLALDRVWITADGRAKLLDFPAPGIAFAPPVVAAVRPQQFLEQIAHSTLDSETKKGAQIVPIPLHARAFLEKLPLFQSMDGVAAALKPLLQRMTIISRWRRAGVVAGCIAFPVIGSLGLIFGLRVYDSWKQKQPDIASLGQVLSVRSAMKLPWVKNKSHPSDKDYGVFIANRYASTITNAQEWTTLFALSTISGEKRRFAEQSLRDYANPTADELEDAIAKVEPLAKTQSLTMPWSAWFPLIAFCVSLILYVGVPALLAAIIFRQGLVLFACGMVVGHPDGRRASRWRIILRSVIAWAPVYVAPLLFSVVVNPLGQAPAVAIAGSLVCALTVLSIWLPRRSLQDRIAGTWLIAR